MLSALLIILPFIFLGGLIDSIAGGGGLISLPAYMAAGLPPHNVLGNNKFSSFFGTLFASIRYYQHGLIDLPVALLSAFFALIGSFSGTRAVLLIDPRFLRYILLGLLPLVTAITLFHTGLGRRKTVDNARPRRRFSLAALAGAGIGFYDGFFGPGTGIFLILFYTLVMKYDLVTANANTKVVNLASNFAALAAFILSGKVLWAIGVPAAVCGIAGNLIGARLVLLRGAKIIRPILVLAQVMLFAKVLYDLLAKH